MTKRRTPKASQPRLDKRMSSAELKELNAAQEELYLLRVELSMKSAQLDTFIARTLTRLGKPLQSTALCCRCGVPHPVDHDHKCKNQANRAL